MVEIKKNFTINIIIFFLYLITIIFINYIYFLYYIEKWPEIIFENGDINILNLPFSFNQVTYNLIKNNELLNQNYYFQTSQYLSRMPIIPLYIKFVYFFITKKFFYIILIKNLFFFFSILILLHLIFRNHIYIFVSFILIIYNFHNITTLTTLVPEEGFLGYLMIILFLSLYLKNINNYLLISFIILIIFFLKSSMVFLCYAISLTLFYLGYKKKSTIIFQ